MTTTRENPLLGRWESPEPGRPWLSFAGDDTVTGSDGCNDIQSTYMAVATGAIVEPFVSTLKACIGVDPWLRGMSTVALRGGRLVVCDAAGVKLGELQRATFG